MTADRTTRIVETFATIADTLVDDYDVVELLQRLVETCAHVLDITAAGIMLADPDGELEVVASTSEASRLIEVLQLDAEAGPCLTCFASGEPVSCADIALGPDDWRDFRTGALDLGFQSVHAMPLRLRSTVIGTLNPTTHSSSSISTPAPPESDFLTLHKRLFNVGSSSDTSRLRQTASDGEVAYRGEREVLGYDAAHERDDPSSVSSVLVQRARPTRVPRAGAAASPNSPTMSPSARFAVTVGPRMRTGYAMAALTLRRQIRPLRRTSS